MSRSFLTQLEQVDYNIGPVYVNLNYSYDVGDMLSANNIILSPPEITIMTPNKEYPKIVTDSGVINNYTNEEQDPFYNMVYEDINMEIVKNNLLSTVNSENNVKEEYLNKLKENLIDFNKIKKYYKK